MQAIRVVPNVPSFAVDNGFWYSVPRHLQPDATVGRIVRAPLGGRRVRGWVVEATDEHRDGLKEISGVSGDLAIFDERLLEALIWAAKHYVAPVSVLLARAGPPNLPKGPLAREEVPMPPASDGGHPLADIAKSVASGKRVPTRALLGRWQLLDWLEAVGSVVSSGQSVVVLAASAAEVGAISERARAIFGTAVIEAGSESDADLTADWHAAQQPGRLLVGTPRVATWMIGRLGLAIVLEEGRRAMKDRQTPTLHVREVLRARSLVEGFTNVFFGPTPSVEILATGADVTMVGNRAWPLVEVVDRSDEAPGSGLLASAVVAALRAVTQAGGRSFVFTSHRAIEPMVKEINAKLGARVAGPSGVGASAVVGTERDLAALDLVELTVASNPDGMLMASGYRTEEETLRQLARLATMLSPGAGHRMMVQTFEPRSALIETLRRGAPMSFLEGVLVERARAGLPPSKEMIAVELRGDIPVDVQSDLGELEGAELMGPIEVEGGRRWLLTGELRTARLQLRDKVGRWRGAGATVRVDADPIDL